MVRLELSESGRPISEEDLVHFESQNGISLDDEYRAFLSESNGGLPRSTTNATLGDSEVEILSFFSLANVTKRHKEIGVIPIGVAFFDRNGIEFLCFDRDNRVGLISEGHSFLQISVSFREFLDSLMCAEIQPDPISRLAAEGDSTDLAKHLGSGGRVSDKAFSGLELIAEAAKFNNVEMIRACVMNGASFSDAPHIAIQNFNLDAPKAIVQARMSNRRERRSWKNARILRHRAKEKTYSRFPGEHIRRLWTYTRVTAPIYLSATLRLTVFAFHHPPVHAKHRDREA